MCSWKHLLNMENAQVTLEFFRIWTRVSRCIYHLQPETVLNEMCTAKVKEDLKDLGSEDLQFKPLLHPYVV